MEVTPEEYERVTAVTYLGQVNGTRAALKRMMPRNKGKSCWSARRSPIAASRCRSAYCGAKHAIQGFLDSVRCELLHDQDGRQHHDGPDAGRQHAAIRLDQSEAAGQAAPGRHRLSAGSGGASASISRRTTGARKMLVGAPTVEAIWGNKVASPCSTIISRGPASRASKTRAGQPRPQGQSVRAGTRRSWRPRPLRRRGGG